MHNIQHPTTFVPESLWTYDQAFAVWSDLESYCSSENDVDVAAALESLLHAHAPVSRNTSQYEYAACNGDCWGDGHNDIPKPWPCPAIMPILYPLGVERRPVV